MNKTTIAALLTALVATGCSEFDDDKERVRDRAATCTVVPALEIAGTFDNNFGGTEIINSCRWNAYYSAPGDADIGRIVTFDNSVNTLIYQADADDSFNASKFGRIRWTEPAGDGTFYYCQEVFGKDTQAEAETDPTVSDGSDPANSGCGSFGWTLNTPN